MEGIAIMARQNTSVSSAIDSHNCPRLNGRCTEQGDHDIHEALLNVLASPFGGDEDRAYTVLSEVDGSLPHLAAGFGSKALTLNLHELDQLIAGVADFHRQLKMQALLLAASIRQAEAGER